MATTGPDRCCVPGVHDPSKTVEQATFDRLRLIRGATGGHLSHFTPSEEMAAEMAEEMSEGTGPEGDGGDAS